MSSTVPILVATNTYPFDRTGGGGHNDDGGCFVAFVIMVVVMLCILLGVAFAYFKALDHPDENRETQPPAEKHKPTTKPNNELTPR